MSAFLEFDLIIIIRNCRYQLLFKSHNAARYVGLDMHLGRICSIVIYILCNFFLWFYLFLRIFKIWQDILVVLQRERFVFAQLDWKFVHFDIICQRHYLTSLATAQNFIEECAPLKFYPLTGEILLFGGDYNHTIGCVERYRNGVHVISLRHAA